jgi:hypothetical protein
VGNKPPPEVAKKNADRAVEYLRDWHPVFALLPKRVSPTDCRWLEYVERRCPSATHWWVSYEKSFRVVESTKAFGEDIEYRAIQK